MWLGIRRRGLYHNHLIHLSKTPPLSPQDAPLSKENPENDGVLTRFQARVNEVVIIY